MIYTDPNGHFCLPCLIALLILLGAITEGCSSPPETSVDLWSANESSVYIESDAVAKKHIEFYFRVTSGEPQNYGLVQFRKGTMKNLASGSFAQVLAFGQPVDANFPDWSIDSVDTDPIYWSNPNGRWNYEATGKKGTFRAVDRPSLPKGYERIYDFKMCIYRLSDVPVDGPSVNVKDLMEKAIKCVSWDFKAAYMDDGTIETK